MERGDRRGLARGIASTEYDAIVSGHALVGDLGGGFFYWEGNAPASAAIAGTAAKNTVIDAMGHHAIDLGSAYQVTLIDNFFGTENQYPAAVVDGSTNGKVGTIPGMAFGTSAPTQQVEVNGGLRPNTVKAQPACSSAARGTFWSVQGASGVKGEVQVCAKDAADTYAWRIIY